jgi:hypothetical protein
MQGELEGKRGSKREICRTPVKPDLGNFATILTIGRREIEMFNK